MNRCANDECILGYESNPEGCSFLDIKGLIDLETRILKGELDPNQCGLWGYDLFKYCPECGYKVEEILYDYNNILNESRKNV